MRTVTIPAPWLIEPSAGVWRVSADILGEEVYFEAPVPLSPRIEAFVCAMTLPAMLQRRDLQAGAAMSQRMIDNLRQARTLARKWWPELGQSNLHALAGSARGRAKGSAVFYTGGVDSSFALYRLQNEITHLLFVEGFDVKLTDTERLVGVRRWMEDMAAATGRRLIAIRTNLRLHRLFKALSWDITHISALSAIAHLLGEQFGTVYVAASDVPPPYGSHPDLDRLWSSESVDLVNYGAEYTRQQRVDALCKWPPLRGRLRVCWQHFASTLNCGRCEKCVRTRLQFLAAGDPAAMDSFPDVSLADALAQVPRAAHDLHSQWRALQTALRDERLGDLIEALLVRSMQPPPPRPPLKRAERAIKRGLRRLSGWRTLRPE